MALLEKAFLDFIGSEQYEDFKEVFDCSRNNYIKYKDNWETSLIDYFLNYTDYGKRYGKRNINTLKRLFNKYLPQKHKKVLEDSTTNIEDSISNIEDSTTDIEENIELSYEDVDEEWRKSRFDMSYYRMNLKTFNEEHYNSMNQYNDNDVLSSINKVKNNNIMAKRIVKDDIIGVFLVYNNNRVNETEDDLEIEEISDIESINNEEENIDEETADENTDNDYW